MDPRNRTLLRHTALLLLASLVAPYTVLAEPRVSVQRGLSRLPEYVCWSKSNLIYKGMSIRWNDCQGKKNQSL